MGKKIYITYEEYKNRYYAVQTQYNKILAEKEQLFAKTQPKSTNFDKAVVDGGKRSNAFDDYLIIKEKKQIDKRLIEVKSILADRKNLLESKETELKNSKEWIDKLYIYKYIENLSIKKILHLIPYEEAQIYRMLKEIKDNIRREYE